MVARWPRSWIAIEKKSISFPEPSLDKGNDGSGNEIEKKKIYSH